MKGLRRLLLVAAAAAGLVLSLTGCSKTVDFLQYADVTFDGLNGQATATVNVDYNKIGTDVFGKGKSQQPRLNRLAGYRRGLRGNP